jgi:hypothetical protein
VTYGGGLVDNNNALTSVASALKIFPWVIYRIPLKGEGKGWERGLGWKGKEQKGTEGGESREKERERRERTERGGRRNGGEDLGPPNMFNKCYGNRKCCLIAIDCFTGIGECTPIKLMKRWIVARKEINHHTLMVLLDEDLHMLNPKNGCIVIQILNTTSEKTAMV